MMVMTTEVQPKPASEGRHTDAPATEWPFVYLASIRRTGSKVLSRALSSFPHGYIFLETGIARGNFNVANREVAILREQGIDLAPMAEHLMQLPRKFRLSTFARIIVPYVQTVARQVGIKEINSAHWRNVVEQFPTLRVVVTARDPRDILLSLAHKQRENRGVAFEDGLEPEHLAAHIREQFGYQRELHEEVGALLVRYEDLCVDPSVLREVRQYTGSTVSGVGLVDRRERGEMDESIASQHGREINATRALRWQSEVDAELLAAAQQVYDLLPQYVEFWGYGRGGIEQPAVRVAGGESARDIVRSADNTVTSVYADDVPAVGELTRPFVYIASLRRTGSTVLAEALTKKPYSFIFREPHFGRNRFALKDDDCEMFREISIDLATLRTQWLADKRSRHLLVALKEDFIPEFAKHYQQLGVKEIRHKGWREYLRAFPDMKVVLTGRDPRDVYVSLYHRQEAGMGSWKGEYTPEAVAADLLEQFAHQRELGESTDSMRVRYEDLCADPGTIEAVKQFVGSAIPGVGEIGVFLGNAKGRKVENDLHGEVITTKRVARWREAEPTLAAEAQQCFDSMTEYTDFWEYER